MFPPLPVKCSSLRCILRFSPSSSIYDRKSEGDGSLPLRRRRKRKLWMRMTKMRRGRRREWCSVRLLDSLGADHLIVDPPFYNSEIATICRFNPKGDLIYVGTSKGNINIWDVQTKAVCKLHRAIAGRRADMLPRLHFFRSSFGAKALGLPRESSIWSLIARGRESFLFAH